MSNLKIRKKVIITLASVAIAILYTVGMFFILGSSKPTDTSTASADGTSSQHSSTASTGTDPFVSSSDTFDGISSEILSGSNIPSWSDILSSNTDPSEVTSSDGSTSNGISSENSPSNTVTSPENEPFKSAMWFSYTEDLNFKGDYSFSTFKDKIDKMFDSAVALGNDAVICQVRPFADSYYPSEIFPWSGCLTGTQGLSPGYDPLAYMIKAAKERNLQFHAWLNPYRISISTNDPNTLAENHIARIWWNDPTKKRNVLALGDVEDGKVGLYFNPTVLECRQLIISGIKEILDNYDVDGIHIDDYFYPTVKPEFDSVEYQQYKSSVQFNALSLDDWRRANVNALVQGIYTEVHKHQGVVFGVSPSYHISTDGTDLNYSEQYADLAKWMSNKGYIDYIVPQLYFGYEHSYEPARYGVSLETWASMPRHSSVKLYIGLGAYKIGLSSDGGSDEWSRDTSILANQAVDAFGKNCSGVVIFNYSSLFTDSDLAKENIKNLTEVLKQK